MEFHVLGPLRVTRDGSPVSIGTAPKPRLLLAALLSRAGQTVPIDALIAALWGDHPPRSARRNIQLYAHQLRRDLGAQRIITEPGGYAIAVEDELDANRFRSLTATATAALDAGNAEEAATNLHLALEMWQGAAFAEFTECQLIADEAARLEQLRLTAQELSTQAGLALGRHAELIPGLSDLARAHPYRETLQGHLMLALYRAGRQADALEVFRETRSLLNDQLGIEPGPQLQALHQAILRGDEELSEVGAEVVRETAADDRCPYQGLTAFQPEHQEWFFGRDQLVDELVDRVDRLPVVGVFGASGSGKSSLLRAGLVSRISGDSGTAERWRVLLLTPTAEPMDVLSEQVAKLARVDAQQLRDQLTADPRSLDHVIDTVLAVDARALLVVDQFEEIFTLCNDPGERRRFIDALLGVALGATRRTTVVLGLRADFLAHLTQHSGLVAALSGDAQLLVGNPSSTDLRDIVVQPAAHVGLRVDPDFLATVLADTGEEPGALPLLSHALLETWSNRSDHALTLSAYQAAGGVRGAIATTAERSYAELSSEQQQAARRIFLRLTALGDSTEDTRRPVSRAELDGVADPQVLERLAEARLIVLTEHAVDVAHEALIRAWPRLHRWLADDRANLFVHRRLTDTAYAWQELDRDQGALFRGAQLLASRTWAEDHPNELNPLEGEFLAASRELEEIEYGAAKRRARLYKRLVAKMAVLLLLALVGGGVAVQQRQQARQERQIEASHQLSLQARSLLATDPDLAGLLAIEAYRMNPDAHTRGALLSTAAAAERRTELNVEGPGINSLAYSPDGSLLASAGQDAVVTLWDPKSRARVATLPEHTAYLPHTKTGLLYARTLDFSRDGRLLASIAKQPALGASPGSLVIWDVRTRKPILQERVDQIAEGMALSPDGAKVAVGVAGGIIEIWDLPARTRTTLKGGHTREVQSLTFTSDQKFLVSTSNGAQEPVVWDVTAARRLMTVPTTHAHTVAYDDTSNTLVTASNTRGVRFWRLDRDKATLLSELPRQAPYAWDISAPTDNRIAVADENGLVTIWDIERGRPVETYKDRQRVETMSLALGHGGTMLATAGLGRTIVIRDRVVPAFGGHSGAINDLEMSPDGILLATASSDTTVRIWDRHGNSIATLPHGDDVQAVSFSPDGRRLAAVTRDHNVTIWDVTGRQKLTTFAYKGIGASTDVVFQPDGHMLATAAYIRFRFDITDLRHPVEKKFPSIALATAVTFSADGRLLVSSSPSGGFMVWDMAADRELVRVRTHQGALQDVALSPDGTLIATAGANRTVKLAQTRTGRSLATLTGHTAPVQVLAFSRDGRTLASAGEDRTIIVWDLATRRPTSMLTGHGDRVQGLTFTADGDLVSGGDDHRIIRWPLAPRAAVGKICDEVGRDLSRQEWTAHIPEAPYRQTCAA